MYQRLKAYHARIEALLRACPEGVDWDDVLREHRDQTAFFQHERLVHLLVTLTFALLELLSALACLAFPQAPVAALALLLLALLLPYIVHYYHLENGVQKLYQQYDLLCAKRSEAHKEGRRGE